MRGAHGALVGLHVGHSHAVCACPLVAELALDICLGAIARSHGVVTFVIIAVEAHRIGLAPFHGDVAPQ